MNKPREWFFNPVCKYRCEVNEDGFGLTGNEVHVVEYSAYSELIAKLEIVKRYHWGDGTITRDMFMDAIGTTRTTTNE